MTDFRVFFRIFLFRLKGKQKFFVGQNIVFPSEVWIRLFPERDFFAVCAFGGGINAAAHNQRFLADRHLHDAAVSAVLIENTALETGSAEQRFITLPFRRVSGENGSRRKHENEQLVHDASVSRFVRSDSIGTSFPPPA